MKIVLLANNIVGKKIASFLIKKKEKIVLLGIHEKEKQKYTKDIIDIVNLPKSNIYTAKKLLDETVVNKIYSLKPDLIICAFWGYILKEKLIKIPSFGCINLHPGYLPYNRGLNPNVWPFIDQTPAGVTIHYIDENIDTGDIICRKKVKINEIDTAETLYNKTLDVIVKLFINNWEKIKLNRIKVIPQHRFENVSTYHSKKDIENLDFIDLNKNYTGLELINILKARSYSDRFYSYYIKNGKKIFLRIQLSNG
jgi:methionyl-tRNA formyltransferase